MTRLAVGLLATLVATACVPALREPPSPPGSVAPGSTAAADVDRWIEEADRAFLEWTPDDVRRAEDLWLRAATADTGRVEAWSGVIRARVWRVEHEDDAEERREVAGSAVHAAQWCERAAPSSAACLYWMGVALGVQARERRSTAVDALPQIVDRLERAIDADESYEQAGPRRVLALVFVRAPGWPTGPGDPELGLEHARRAVELAPDHPPNRLCLAEALAETGDRAGSFAEYEAAADLARSLEVSGLIEAGEWLAEARKRGEAGQDR